MGSEGRLEAAVEGLREVSRKTQPDDYPGNWRLRVGEVLAAWDEAVEGMVVQGEAAFEGMTVSSGAPYLDATLEDEARFIERFRSVKWAEQEPEVVSEMMFNAVGRVIGLLGDLKRAVGRLEAEGERPALVGEDAEAPVAVGPTDKFCRPERTDKFGVAPSDAPCPVPPKPEPDCCTDDEDLFGEEDNEPWGLDAMDDMEKLREGLRKHGRRLLVLENKFLKHTVTGPAFHQQFPTDDLQDEDLFDDEDYDEDWGIDYGDDIEALREGFAALKRRHTSLYRGTVDLKKRFEEHIAL